MERESSRQFVSTLERSHGRALHRYLASPRNVSYELIDAIAQSGGVIGVVEFPAMVANTTKPSLDQFIAHIDAIVECVGIDHVGLGLDYYVGQGGVASEEEALRGYQDMVARGVWGVAYPPPPGHAGSVGLTEKNRCERNATPLYRADGVAL